MDDGPERAPGLSDSARQKAVGLLGRELVAAWMKARAAGTEARDLLALMRERLAQLRSGAPTPGTGIRAMKHGPSYGPRPSRVQDSGMTAGAFIGREPELARLSRILDAAYAFRPTTVFLSGDAGVGKSRLLDEFAERARQGDDRVFVLRGECVDLSEAARIPYGPLVGALREFVREHGEQAARLAGRGWGTLRGLVAGAADEPPRSGVGGEPVTAQAVFEVVRQVLGFLGLKKPAVLILEDLHWADQSTLDLVVYLARSLKEQRVVLICSHRGDLEQGHPLRSRLAEPRLARVVETMAVQPFTEDECRAFLRSVGPADQDQLRLGFQLSEGNAFFAEELWFSGVLLDPRSGRVPRSVAELMLKRIGWLSEPARGLLGVAAIAARRVGGRLLAEVSTLTQDELEDALRECVEHGMLAPDPAHDAYVFRHALLRETVYDHELPAIRRRRHAAMAEAITADPELRPDEDASLAVELAHHWYHAGRRPQALAASLRAGAMTARLRAFPEAETHYRRALELWAQVDSPEDLADAPRERVLAQAADAARWAGHVAQAAEFIRAAISELADAGRPRRSGELHERLGSYLWEAGDPEGSAQAYAEALRLLSLEPPAGATDVMVLSGLAGAASRAGHHTEALRLAQQSADLASTVGAVTERGRSLNGAGVASTMLGRAEDGVRLLRESLEIADRAGQLEDMFRAYGNLGFALEYAGDPAGAAQVALEGLDRARESGIAFARQAGLLANNAGAALLLLGEWDRAAALLDAALLDDPSIEQSAYLRLSRAEIELARGNLAAVDRRLAELADQRPTDPRFVGALRACEAELALWRGLPRQALDTVLGALGAIAAGENEAEELRLCALGLRAAADLRTRGRADPDVIEQVAQLGARAERRGAEHGPELPQTPVLRRQCAAEHDRAAGRDTSAAWDGIALTWEHLRRPYQAAYARWRQAAALRAEKASDAAARVTREALESAAKLGARPLEAALARSAGLPPETALSAPLTKRQLEVAALAAQDKSNAEIAKALDITVSTVGRHIHDAMEALRRHGYPVSGRTGLANYLREHGLLGDPPGRGEGDSP